MRSDYCPMANEPCQSMCDQPCSAQRLKPPADVPLLSDAEVANIRKRNQAHNEFARAIEKAVRQKAGL